MKKKIIGLLLIMMFVAVGCTKEKEIDVEVKTDSLKFSEEYTMVEEDNAFVYKDLNEINKILENGTGIVYLGFPECPWCQQYVKYLNEVANDYEVEKIYYCNVLEDRTNNTADYQRTVELLSEYLQYDEEGNKRVYVPTVVAVNKGEIVGFDDETAWDTKGFEDPKDYWNEDSIEALKVRLEKMILDTSLNVCTDCNK